MVQRVHRGHEGVQKSVDGHREVLRGVEGV